MAAAAFSETLIFKGMSNGRSIQMYATVSDVAGQFATFSDGNTFMVLPADQNYALTDVIVVVGGTDTNIQNLYINGLPSGIVVGNKSNLNTANFRQFQQAPIPIKGGSMLRLTQAA